MLLFFLNCDCINCWRNFLLNITVFTIKSKPKATRQFLPATHIPINNMVGNHENALMYTLQLISCWIKINKIDHRNTPATYRSIECNAHFSFVDNSNCKVPVLYLVYTDLAVIPLKYSGTSLKQNLIWQNSCYDKMFSWV